ncbi:MAG: glycosyltransferase family 4 protein [Bacteroidaceae bacterium]|nr:glycosyltransferase family 4 protein [Bacteroidaceae bacterium]
MKIAIEAQRIFRKNKHGMDFVALEMIRNLQLIDKENEYFIMVSPGEDHCLAETPNFHIVEISTPSYPLWEQWGLPKALRKIKPDLLHCTSNTAPIWDKTPLVLTLHDIIFLEPRDSTSKSLYQNLGWYYRRLDVPRILGRCRKIITVSDFERDNILRKTSVSASQIVTVHNGFSSQFHPIDNYRDTVRKYIDAEHYLFFLGNTDPKKNTKRVLKAYAEYASRSKSPVPLLVADLSSDILSNYITELGLDSIRSLIKASGYIEHKDLTAIYNGASAFIYTSLRESFGIPLLEAMACGTPVISSDTSAIPEIAGNAAVLVDPRNVEAISDAILQLEENEPMRRQYIERGLERVKLFSWRNTAEKVLKLYNEIKNQSPQKP